MFGNGAIGKSGFRSNSMEVKKDYITPAGFRKLQDELHQLLKVERPQVVVTVTWAASNGDRSENADYQYGKRRLRQIDKRAEFLLKKIDSLQIIDPATISSDRVLFGATVQILNDQDQVKTYSIVGVEEVDVSKGKISWQSPLGAALLKSKVGDYVTYGTPNGELGVEIQKITYQSIA